MTNEVKTFTPILPIGTGPTGTNLHDALYDFFNHLVEENCSDDLFSDSKIEELVADFIQLTGMNEWEDGEYTVLSDYKIRIETMPVSKFENMHEFEGY